MARRVSAWCHPRCVDAMPVLHGAGLGGMMRVVNAGVSGGFCPVHMFT